MSNERPTISRLSTIVEVVYHPGISLGLSSIIFHPHVVGRGSFTKEVSALIIPKEAGRHIRDTCKIDQILARAYSFPSSRMPPSGMVMEWPKLVRYSSG